MKPSALHIFALAALALRGPARGQALVEQMLEARHMTRVDKGKDGDRIHGFVISQQDPDKNTN